jgi:hypothetical protein
MEVGDQLHAPATLSTEKGFCYLQKEVGWVLKPVLAFAEEMSLPLSGRSTHET